MKLALALNPAGLNCGSDLDVNTLSVVVAGVGEVVKQDQPVERHDSLQDRQIIFDPSSAVIAVDEGDGWANVRISASEASNRTVDKHDPVSKVPSGCLRGRMGEVVSVNVECVDGGLAVRLLEGQSQKNRGLPSIGADLEDRATDRLS